MGCKIPFIRNMGGEGFWELQVVKKNSQMFKALCCIERLTLCY